MKRLYGKKNVWASQCDVSMTGKRLYGKKTQGRIERDKHFRVFQRFSRNSVVKNHWQ